MPTLEITTMVGCPLRCTACPQDALRGSYGKAEKYLTFANFRTIVNKLPPHIRIDLSGMAEPWANPDATGMLTYALNAGRRMAIYTTLYGMEDGEQVAAQLTARRSQIDVLCLHLPDASGNMRGWKYNAKYEANVRRFWGLRHILPRFEAMTMSGSGSIHPDLADIGVELGAWVGHTRAGNVDPSGVSGAQLEQTPKISSAVMCSFTPFYDQNVMLPNGDIVLCCADYSIKHKIGNLLEQDYYDIFAGPELGRLRAENMKQQFSRESLCKTCNRARPLKAAGQFWTA